MKISRPLRMSALSLLVCVAPFAAAFLSAPMARAQSVYTTPYTFTTLAGIPYVPGATDGTGAAAQFSFPGYTALDASGNLYVADQGSDTIRKVTPSGVVTTLAGASGIVGSANGTGSAARFNGPLGIAVDGSGNVYVADTGNDTIRMITPAGVVTTLAGTPLASGSGDGTGAAAQFANPAGIAVDGSGNIYVADELNDTIRKVTSAGVVTTFAGTAGSAGIADGTGANAKFRAPYGVALDSAGNLYVADAGNNTIRKITSAAVVTTLAGNAGVTGSTDGTGSAALFYVPIGVAVDGSGNVYVSDYDNNTIRKVTSGGVVTTLAGTVKVVGFVDGTGTAAKFTNPVGVSVDGAGNVYVGESGDDLIRKIDSGGTVTTLAGFAGGGDANGTGSAARFNIPTGITVDGSGNLYVADEFNDLIRKITPGGAVTTLAGTPGSPGSSDGTGSAALFYSPFGIAVDGAGNVYVTDANNDTIRKITPSGAVSTLAGSTGKPGSTNGTGSAALFNDPVGIAVDGNGNVYVSEQGNFDIRMITPAGAVTTLAGTAGAKGFQDGTGPAAQFNLPAGLAVDGNGNVYVADYTNSAIRKITPAGVVTTIAGQATAPGSADGTGTAAQFYQPTGVAVDGAGNVYVCEQTNDTVRRITPAGVVTTLAGSPKVFGSANGTGAAARFTAPDGIAVDSLGNLYVADTGNDTIRKGTLSGAPQIETQPSDQYVAVGGTATFSVAASGSTALSYQWRLNGAAIPGATGASYTVLNAQASSAGAYTVTVTDSDGSTTSTAGHLYVNTGSTNARLINIATRAQVGTGANILIPGFVIAGGGTETLLIRGDGPALTQFGVAGALAQPSLSLFDSTGKLIATNTGWTTSTNPAQITSVASQVGAFAFAAGSADCALIANLPAGAYTVQISGVSNSTGVALAEVYEVSSSGTSLINIATRAQVGTGGNILIPGFVIGGSGTEELLVRADGPALTQFGVGGALAQPSLSLFDSTGKVIATNTVWGTDTSPTPAQIAGIASSVGAFALTLGSADSVLVADLAPGAYTIQVSGVSSTTGVALAEIYVVP